MEEESHDSVLLNTLVSFGISIPNNVVSIQKVDPQGLVSISSQCLNIITDNNNNSSSSSCWFPTCLPDSMLEQIKICTDISIAIKDLGSLKDFTFQQFLYPSEEDKYELISFLVERLSESSALNGEGSYGTKSIEHDCMEGKSESLAENVPETRFMDHRLEAFESSCTGDEFTVDTVEDNKNDCGSSDVLKSKVQYHGGDESSLATMVSGSNEQLSEQKKDVSGKMDSVDGVNDNLQEQVLKEQVSEMRNKIESLTNNEDELNEVVQTETLDLLHLEDELESLKAAMEMVSNNNHSMDFFVSELNEEIESRKTSLHEKEMQWNTLRKHLQDKKRSLEESLYANKPELHKEFQKLKEVEEEVDSISLEIRKKEEEFSKLSSELETLPKLESRRSHIQRIQEITKNSRKQDADIERILKETRELHLESNFIQERLHRTYAVTDETVFREAKRDLVGRQAYRLLTSIHENFEKIFEIIMSTDRVRREIAEHEKKLAAMAPRNLNADKLQADLDALIKENESLEQQLRDS